MSIGRTCPRGALGIRATASLRQAATLMRRHGVGELVVTVRTVQGEQAVGMVTLRDLAIEALLGRFDERDNHVMQVADPQLARMHDGIVDGVQAAAMRPRVAANSRLDTLTRLPAR